jgi:hypothetical protein
MIKCKISYKLTVWFIKSIILGGNVDEAQIYRVIFLNLRFGEP